MYNVQYTCSNCGIWTVTLSNYILPHRAGVRIRIWAGALLRCHVLLLKSSLVPQKFSVKWKPAVKRVFLWRENNVNSLCENTGGRCFSARVIVSSAPCVSGAGKQDMKVITWWWHCSDLDDEGRIMWVRLFFAASVVAAAAAAWNDLVPNLCLRWCGDRQHADG